MASIRKGGDTPKAANDPVKRDHSAVYANLAILTITLGIMKLFGAVTSWVAVFAPVMLFFGLALLVIVLAGAVQSYNNQK